MAGDEATYSVEVWDLDEFFEILERFPESQQQRVTEFLSLHLTTRPRTMIPGLLKELKGKWKGVYQFECGGPRRLLYEVDEQARKVRVTYLGEHPDWDKRGRMDSGR